MPESEITAFLIDEPQGNIRRVALARPLVAVVVTKSGPVQLMPLVRMISDLRGLELSEVAPRLAASSGILLRDATANEAESLAAELHRQDVPYVLIPTRELPEFEEVATLFRIRVGSGGIRIRRANGSHIDLKWNKILTITCVRLEAPVPEGETPARLILSIITREPFSCYQLVENLPAGRQATSSVPYKPSTRFERLGREIYESFTSSAQNKGMRILSTYGRSGKWKGLTFDSLEEVGSYNYWVALLRKHQLDLRGTSKPRFSVPWLRRIEFESEAIKPEPTVRYRVRSSHVPPPVRKRPPVLLSPPPPADWIPAAMRGSGIQSVWLNLATIIAAICLAIFIILELAG